MRAEPSTPADGQRLARTTRLAVPSAAENEKMPSPTEATPVAHDSAARPKKRAPRRLVDPRFQLKHTAWLVGVIAVLMAAAGVVIVRSVNQASRFARDAAAQAERALRESQTATRAMHMNRLLEAAEGPEETRLAVEREFVAADRAAERNLAQARQQGSDVEGARRRLLLLLLGVAVALLVLVAVMGIVITERIVGPVFRVKRMLRQVGTGRLVAAYGPRKHDELGDLFETFQQMTYSLKALQLDRIATLDLALRRAKDSGTAAPVLETLHELRGQMCLGLPRTTVPPPPFES
jgi:hypothetical protein